MTEEAAKIIVYGAVVPGRADDPCIPRSTRDLL